MTLWIGDKLGPVERACMRSAIQQGHALRLYCYDRPAGVPAGVELADASEIIPESAVVRHRSGSVAPFSDWFRIELQRRGAGTWIDTDVYLLHPLDQSRPYLFGEEREGVINNAVLRLPAQSRLCEDLLKLLQRQPARPQSVVKRLLARRDLQAGPWGATGPRALTAAAKKLGVASHALPSAAFYPVPWQNADWILDPALSLEDMVSEASVAVHLWNECIRTFKDLPAPDGSFLARLHREGE